MPFTLDEVVPWGRSFDEYVAMFHLTAEDLEKRILGCGDGPASFNAVMRKLGKTVVSVDPLYAFSAEQIRQRIEVAFTTILEQLVANQASYVWTNIKSPEHLGQVRMEAMEAFLEDCERGKRERRYLAAELPDLPFGDQQFDLCLCSHLLFTYWSFAKRRWPGVITPEKVGSTPQKRRVQTISKAAFCKTSVLTRIASRPAFTRKRPWRCAGLPRRCGSSRSWI